MKKSVPIKPFWYSDVIVLPKLVTVLTTVNKEGVVNAAPYSFHPLQRDEPHSPDPGWHEKVFSHLQEYCRHR